LCNSSPAYRPCLDKAAAHAEAKKIDPVVLLDAKLYPDMFPLVRQVRETTSHAAANRQMRDCNDSLPCPVQSTQSRWPARHRSSPIPPLR
jgi:hypothetical protein